MFDLWNLITDPSYVSPTGVWIIRFLIILLVFCTAVYWIAIARRVHKKDIRALSPVVALRYLPQNASECRALMVAPFFIIFLFSIGGIWMGTYGVGSFILCTAGFVSSLLYYHRKWKVISLLFMGITALFALGVAIVRL